MATEWCKRCDGLMFSSTRHECPPMWLVWRKDDMDPEDGKLIRARDGQQAAEKWADWYDSYGADYSIVGGSEVIVGVRRDGDDETIEFFEVSGRTEAVYDARKVPSGPR